MTRDDWLKNVAQNLVWVELGVFKGDFSKKIYEISKPKLLHLVDTFPNMMVSGDKDGNNIVEADISSVPELLEAYFNTAAVRIHKMTTDAFLNQLPDKSVDIVYIDADHAYDAVKSDLNLALPKIKKNGLLTGHDYCPSQFPGVYNAVNEFCIENSLRINLLTNDRLPTYVINIT